MTNFKGLVRQLKVMGKRFRGRCEPELIEQILYVDPMTAVRLSQYAEEHLGLYWKNKSDWIR